MSKPIEIVHGQYTITFDPDDDTWNAEYNGTYKRSIRLSEVKIWLNRMINNASKFEPIECLYLDGRDLRRVRISSAFIRRNSSCTLVRAAPIINGDRGSYSEYMLQNMVPAEAEAEAKEKIALAFTLEEKWRLIKQQMFEAILSIPRLKLDPEKHPVVNDNEG